MRVIVFASQKGGSGKTTLAGHIAVEAAEGGSSVALVDTDPQGSLAKWWNVRSSETPVFIQSTFSNLFSDIETVREMGVELVVVDTPPAVTRAIAEVVNYADLVILPTRPSPHDLRAVGATVDIVESKRKNMVFVVNAATARAKITSEAAIALSQHGTVAPVIVHQRTDFAASMIDGRTVMEVNPSCRSANEIRELWAYLQTRLAKIERVANDDAPNGETSLAASNLNALGKSAPAFGRRFGS